MENRKKNKRKRFAEKKLLVWFLVNDKVWPYVVHETETSFGIGIVLRKHRPNELETFNNNLKTI